MENDTQSCKNITPNGEREDDTSCGRVRELSAFRQRVVCLRDCSTTLDFFVRLRFPTESAEVGGSACEMGVNRLVLITNCRRVPPISDHREARADHSDRSSH